MIRREASYTRGDGKLYVTVLDEPLACPFIEEDASKRFNTRLLRGAIFPYELIRYRRSFERPHAVHT